MNYYKNKDRTCEFCKKEFPLLDKLDEHLFSAHGIYSGKQTCEFCEKELSSLTDLDEHVWNVHGIIY